MANSSLEGRHYAFLVFLTLLNVMNFVDRQLLASFANFIVPDLRLTNAEFGLLTGLAFSAPLIAYAATLKGNENFNAIFRFVVTPLFLFSGVFFPLTRLPPALRAAAWLTPLFHGVELTRALTLGTVESSWYVHVGYLVAMMAAGVAAAIRTFERRLRP